MELSLHLPITSLAVPHQAGRDGAHVAKTTSPREIARECSSDAELRGRLGPSSRTTPCPRRARPPTSAGLHQRCPGRRAHDMPNRRTSPPGGVENGASGIVAGLLYVSMAQARRPEAWRRGEASFVRVASAMRRLKRFRRLAHRRSRYLVQPTSCPLSLSLSFPPFSALRRRSSALCAPHLGGLCLVSISASRPQLLLMHLCVT